MKEIIVKPGSRKERIRKEIRDKTLEPKLGSGEGKYDIEDMIADISNALAELLNGERGEATIKFLRRHNRIQKIIKRNY